MREGDEIEIVIDRVNLEGSVNLVVNGDAAEGARELAARPLRDDLAPDPAPAGRHAPVGHVAGHQRRHLGRLRLRRRSHRPAAATELLVGQTIAFRGLSCFEPSCFEARAFAVRR